jgi:hypothetical protein
MTNFSRQYMLRILIPEIPGEAKKNWYRRNSISGTKKTTDNLPA